MEGMSFSVVEVGMKVTMTPSAVLSGSPRAFAERSIARGLRAAHRYSGRVFDKCASHVVIHSRKSEKVRK